MLTILNILAVAFSVGFLIFFHELGHFLIAKKVGIRVEAFSIGMGPRLFGFVRGETDYKICAFPLGGYVKMAGEAPGEDRGNPRAFSNKTIAQRAWVVSGGVIANALLALILFPLAFGIGVPVKTTELGDISVGGPAWNAGLRSGDRVLEVDGEKIHGFQDLSMNVIFASDEIPIRFERDGETFERSLRPLYDDALGAKRIGVGAAFADELIIQKPDVLGLDVPQGTRVVSVNGENPSIFFEKSRTGQRPWPGSEGSDLVLEIEGRGIDRRTVKVASKTKAAPKNANPSIGIVMGDTEVAAIVPESAATKIGFKKGDVLLSCEGRDLIDSHDLKAKLQTPADETAISVRDAQGQILTRRAALTASERQSLTYDLAFSPVPRIVALRSGGPGERGGLHVGDIIAAVGQRSLSLDSKGAETLKERIFECEEGRALPLRVQRGSESVSLSLQPEKAPIDLVLTALARREKTQEVKVGFVESINVGVKTCANQFIKIFMSFRALLTGQVSAKNMGGIITISVVSYTFVEQGLGKMLWFMAFLSVNLAFLNILPIPMLDGGHLVFLICEKIKGSPLSDRAMGIANLGGLIIVVGLMVFVTYNDIARFFL